MSCTGRAILLYNMRMKDTNRFEHEFFRQVQYPWHLGRLFDHLPDTYFFAKNLRGQFVMVNPMVVELLGAHGVEEVLGKTDHDFFPPDVADRHVDHDRRVIRAGRPLVNQAWLVPDHRGGLKWYIATKIPLMGTDGKVVGVAGVMRDVAKAGALLQPYREIQPLLSYVLQHYKEKFDSKHLARLTRLSASQLNRRFKRLFQMSPRQFVLHVRINAACYLLTRTQSPLSVIALETGFFDQSHFCRLFKRALGITPTTYRRRYPRPTSSAEAAGLESLSKIPERR